MCVQVLIIYLQYNFIASKLPLNWPTGLINFVGGIQVFFTSGEGIFSLDCLLQVLGFRVAGSACLPQAVPSCRCTRAPAELAAVPATAVFA